MRWKSYSNPQELGTTPRSAFPHPLDFVVECQDMIVNEDEGSSGIDMPCQCSVIVLSTNRPWTGSSTHAWPTASTRKLVDIEEKPNVGGSQGHGKSRRLKGGQ